MRNLPFVALTLSTALVAPAQAQYAAYPQMQAAPAASPADQLAAVMRRLATAPNDLYSLINAGELSMKLDDMSAAAAFFARADKIDPRNGRVKAGMGSILVRAERPGEALRYFQMAESYGLPAVRFAADRGLAYDLLGEQERAQRDYRLALATGRDDETVRRYALSLAISGDQATAVEQLEPLVRRQDRAAWRVRAFVLAMTGDVAGASRIATTMMPAGMAGGLQPFFQRLPAMTAADRAFAVHFGELRPTPQRLADARLKPVLPALGPDPFPLVRTAAVAQPAAAQQPTVLASRQDRRAASRNPSDRFGERWPASRRSIPRQTASRQPVPPAVRLAAPAQAYQRPATPPPVQVASARPIAPSVRTAPAPQAARTVAPSNTVSPIRAASAPIATPAPTRLAGVTPWPSSPTRPLAADAAPAPVQPIGPAPIGQPVQVASIAAATAARPNPGLSVPPASAPLAGLPASGAVAGAPQSALTTPASAPPSPAGAEVASVAATSSPPVSAVRSEDSILARIVSSIVIPAEELGVAPPVRREAAAAVAADPAARLVLAQGKAKAAREEADRAAAARTVAAAAKAKPGVRGAKSDVDEDVRAVAKGKGGRVELASRSATRGKTGARAEAEDDGKTAKPRNAAERRVAEKKAAEGKADKAKPETGRYWVQVAGGANEGDLPKAWAAAKKKASALQGRDAYTAKQRATSRVLTGPFKTEEEAQAFVNKLSRQGVSAFTYTSESGRKPTKLPAK